MCLGYPIFIKENAESVGRNGISRVAFRGWNDLVTQFLSGVREERWSKWNFGSCFSRLKNVKKGQRPKIDPHVMKGWRKEVETHW